MPDERSERKMTPKNDDIFADLNPEFYDNVVFPVYTLLISFQLLVAVALNVTLEIIVHTSGHLEIGFKLTISQSSVTSDCH